MLDLTLNFTSYMLAYHCIHLTWQLLTSCLDQVSKVLHKRQWQELMNQRGIESSQSTGQALSCSNFSLAAPNGCPTQKVQILNTLLRQIRYSLALLREFMDHFMLSKPWWGTDWRSRTLDEVLCLISQPPSQGSASHHHSHHSCSQLSRSLSSRVIWELGFQHCIFQRPHVSFVPREAQLTWEPGHTEMNGLCAI